MAIRRARDEDEDEILTLDRAWSMCDPAAPCTWWIVDGDPSEGYAGAYIVGTEVHLERAYVAPHARGRGLQRKLIRVREAWARTQGCVLATTYTASDNVASMRALVRSGYLPTPPRHGATSEWIRWDKDLRRG